MKKIYIFALAAALTMSLTGCDDFLDYTPTAVVDEDKAFSNPEKMVNSAYAMLGDCWYSYPFNLWPYGDLASDDCLKGGSGTGDTGYHDIEVWSSLTSTRGELDELWYRLNCAVSRCNRALVSLEENGSNVLGDQTTTEREAEVRFLRAHFYFKLISVFRQVPWIDEQVYKDKATEKTPNTQYTYEQLFGKVIDDFKFAFDHLPEKQNEGGRAKKIAAAAYLAKCYLTLAWGDGYEATDGVNHINKEYYYRVSIGFPYDGKDIIWSTGKCFNMGITGLVSGFIAGTIGIGGGVVLVPILLSLGIHPVVSTVTTNFLVLLTSSSTSLQFMLNNMMNYEYACISIVFSVLGSYIGTKIIHHYFKQTGRESLLIFALVFVIGSSALILPLSSILSTINDVERGVDVFRFNSPCGAN